MACVCRFLSSSARGPAPCSVSYSSMDTSILQCFSQQSCLMGRCLYGAVSSFRVGPMTDSVLELVLEPGAKFKSRSIQGKNPWFICVCVLAVSDGTGEPVVFIYLALFRGLTTGIQQGAQVLDCRAREMGLRLLGGSPKFFLVQFGRHSTLCFLISHLPWLHE